jgi:hypothetical protein
MMIGDLEQGKQKKGDEKNCPVLEYTEYSITSFMSEILCGKVKYEKEHISL